MTAAPGRRLPARRRTAALAGLALSAALAAGAVGGWVLWRQTDKVGLSGPRHLALPTVPDRPVGAAVVTTTISPTTTAALPTITALSPPARISIPSAGIAAQVVPEGLDQTGSLVIPPPAQVAWYEGGPLPGQDGTTLLAGHIDDYGVPGAFLHLNSVPVGATVELTTADGRTLAYTVTDRQSVVQTRLAGSGLLSSSGPPRLVLITCGGDYDYSTHLYLDNIVLVARPTTGAGSAG
jgi:hypothetical protein